MLFRSLLVKASESGEISSLFLGNSIDFPSHLLYADDVIIFCRASLANCRAILTILEKYAAWSGQKFNPQKSRAYFSSFIPVSRRRLMCRRLTITEGQLPFIYLGVPLFRGVPHLSHLQPLADSVLAKLSK